AAEARGARRDRPPRLAAERPELRAEEELDALLEERLRLLAAVRDRLGEAERRDRRLVQVRRGRDERLALRRALGLGEPGREEGDPRRLDLRLARRGRALRDRR